MVLRNRPTLIIGTERLACVNSPPGVQRGTLASARDRSRVRAPGPAGALRALFFSTLPSFLLPEIVFFRTFPTNPAKVLGLFYTTSMVYNNPNTLKSYKILQKLSPKHAAHGVAQSTYPNYRHGKACLCKQPPWRAAGDPCISTRQVPGSSPGSGGHVARAFFLHPPFLPPSGDSFFRTFPTNPAKVLGLIFNSYINI